MPPLVTSARRFAHTRMGGAIVLRYHRVADLPSDPNSLLTSPDRFREHIEIIRRNYNPVRLEDLDGSAEKRRIPPRSVAVTFDDGYADNLTRARPVLERFDVGATVFVTTGYVDAGREFWWDTLDRIFLTPGDLSPRLRIRVGAQTHEFDLGSSAAYSEADFGAHRHWNWRADHDPTARHTVFRRLSELLKPLRFDDREAALEALTTWARTETGVRSGYRVLSRDEMLQLVDGGLVGIGAHSVSHPMLSRLEGEDQRREIEGSKAWLEGVLGRPVTCFAYPFGVIGRTAGLLRQAGFRSGWGTRPGVVFRRGRRYRLPRLYVGNWDGEEFERRLRLLG